MNFSKFYSNRINWGPQQYMLGPSTTPVGGPQQHMFRPPTNPIGGSQQHMFRPPKKPIGGLNNICSLQNIWSTT
jgi:hypothetical protein